MLSGKCFQFAKYPLERTVNEASFKLLSSYLNVMLDDKKLPRPIEATFYLKPRVVKKVTSFRKVRVTLRDVVRVRDAVTVVLKSVDLPTSYVDSLPDEGDKEKVSATSAEVAFEEPEFYDVTTGFGMHSTDVNRPLPRWLRDNVESARVQLAKSEPIRYEVERLQVSFQCHFIKLAPREKLYCCEILKLLLH